MMQLLVAWRSYAYVVAKHVVGVRVWVVPWPHYWCTGLGEGKNAIIQGYKRLTSSPDREELTLTCLPPLSFNRRLARLSEEPQLMRGLRFHTAGEPGVFYCSTPDRTTP